MTATKKKIIKDIDKDGQATCINWINNGSIYYYNDNPQVLVYQYYIDDDDDDDSNMDFFLHTYIMIDNCIVVGSIHFFPQ